MRSKVPIVVKPSNAHYPKQHLFVRKKKKEKPEGEGAPAPEYQVFPISIMETLLNWLLLASLWRV